MKVAALVGPLALVLLMSGPAAGQRVGGAARNIGRSARIRRSIRQARSARRSPRLVRIPSVRVESLMPEIQRVLRARNYRGQKVLIRVFSPERLGQALRTGTDRDGTSVLYDIPVADSSAAERTRRGVADRLVTYAHLVDWRSRDPMVHYLSLDDQRLAPALAGSDAIPVGQAVAVYDASKLRRASEVEYWFKGNPRDALLMVLVKPAPRPRSRPDPLRAELQRLLSEH